MRTMLITGGTVFVSRFAAQYFLNHGWDVWVLNRNTHPQVSGVHLIEADRSHIGDALRGYSFDAVLAINSYTRADVEHLVNALDSVKDFIFISSSAVYPETLPQPFTEEQECGPNAIWGCLRPQQTGSGKLASPKRSSGLYSAPALPLRPHGECVPGALRL